MCCRARSFFTRCLFPILYVGCPKTILAGDVPLFPQVHHSQNLPITVRLMPTFVSFWHWANIIVLCLYGWWNSKSSIILGLAVTVPMLVAAVSVALPIWVHNGYSFYQTPALEFHATRAWEQQARRGRTKEVGFSRLIFCGIKWGISLKSSVKVGFYMLVILKW